MRRRDPVNESAGGPGGGRSGSLLRWLVLTLIVVGASFLAAASRPAVASFRVSTETVMTDVRRIGINLGRWESWGAQQLGSNVLHNPGFEGVVDGAVVIVRQAWRTGFTDDSTRLARPDGFWVGAGFEVRTGSAAGYGGTVASSRAAGRGGYPEIVTREPLPPLALGDVVALRRTSDDEPLYRWRVPESSRDLVRPQLADRRPRSPGRRSVLLRGEGGRRAELFFDLDGLGDRAGRLLPVVEPWRLDFWCRGGGELTVRFHRHGSVPLVEQRVAGSPGWRQVSLQIPAENASAVGALELGFAVESGRVALDDVYLGPAEEPETAFRREVVALLERLQPGYLRDWQEQAGDSLENRFAEPFERRLSRAHPRAGSARFGYSIPEVLELAATVNARPWIIAPLTLGDTGFFALGRRLERVARRLGLDEVVVELGNESWNHLGRPAGVPDPRSYGELAARASRRLREGAPGLALVTAANGQFVAPDRAAAGARVAEVDLLAVAPYFLYSLAPGEHPVAKLFPGAGQFEALAAAVSGEQELAVYEVNLHTTGGEADDNERNRVVASAASGTALAARILTAQSFGARRQCVYALAGFDNWREGRAGLVRLWGVARDLGPTSRLRPTGLALALINRALGTERLSFDAATAQGLTFAPYRSAKSWTAIVASSDLEPRTVEIIFPSSDPPLPTRLLRLESQSPWHTNEEAERVRLVEENFAMEGRKARLEVPPLGLVALAGGSI